MGHILTFINDNNEGHFHCYRSTKTSLDDTNQDLITSENSDQDTIPLDTTGRIAESNTTRVNTVRISNSLIKDTPAYFQYFLDGSRHTYKVDDISIGEKIYPIIAGQIVVGCCHRPDKDTFKTAALQTKLAISLPKSFHTKGKSDDFRRSYCEKMNQYLKEKSHYFSSRNLSISDVLLYKIDGQTVGDVTDKNRFKNSGIAQIQNLMTDTEQLMVSQLCKENKINDESWLIKDGSLQYNPNYSNLDKNQFATLRMNYQHVVGVSKSFDPGLLKNFEGKKLSKIIADLQPFERTKAYKYVPDHSNGAMFAIWYLRLRNSNFRETNLSDVVKCEMIMLNPSASIDTELIDVLSANIIREAYPVCFGKDSRWANHLYPVYLTETFCKAQYINSNIFLELF